jgi:hypothetical protein
VTHPGVPVSPGYPPFEGPARDALRAARGRIGAAAGERPFLPPMGREEREEALESAASAACRFCAGFHPGASTPACPRLATFKLNGDGMVIEGSYWPDGVTEETVETNGAGQVVTVISRTASQWDTAKVVAVADVAEEEAEDGGGADA